MSPCPKRLNGDPTNLTARHFGVVKFCAAAAGTVTQEKASP
jgi:hypothetical protein